MDDIRELMNKHRQSRVFHIQNNTQLENFLKQEDYVSGIYYHHNLEEFEKEVIDQLLQYP
jgi:hypothetical protein